MNLSFSIIIILKLVFFAVLLFAFFRVILYFIPLIINKNNNIKLLKRKIPIVELFAWLLFSIWAFKKLIEENQYFAFAIFVVMLSVAIFSARIFLKDYIAGIIVKSDSSIILGDTISTKNFTGIIKKYNYRTLELELENKSIAKIPYTDILNNSLVRNKKTHSILGHSFKITTSKKQNVRIIIKEIKDAIILLPWALTSKEPVIKVVSETSNTYNIELTIFAHSNDMNFNIEKHIKDKFSV